MANPGDILRLLSSESNGSSAQDVIGPNNIGVNPIMSTTYQTDRAQQEDGLTEKDRTKSQLPDEEELLNNVLGAWHNEVARNEIV